MTFQKSNLINASVLTLVSLWLYYDAINKDFGLLIPFLFGVVLLSLNQGIIYENRQQKNAAFGITIISLAFILYMVMWYYNHDSGDQIYYFGFMGLTGLWSILIFLLNGSQQNTIRRR